MTKLAFALLVFFFCSPAFAQDCSLTSFDMEQESRSRVGNEIIVRIFVVKKYYVSVAGDDNNDYLRSFTDESAANAALEACRKADYGITRP